jgi:hypothetical protein
MLPIHDDGEADGTGRAHDAYLGADSVQRDAIVAAATKESGMKNKGAAFFTGGIGMGIAIGVALGGAMDNIGLGIALGVAIGAGLGSAGMAAEKKKDDKDQGPKA